MAAARAPVHVGLQHEPLDLNHIINFVRSDAAGAIVTFSGTTRDHFNGRQVLHLDYEAHDKLALASLEQICRAAVDQYALRGAACFHRLGRVPVGEESIMIAVSSDHREAAWHAGQQILEEAKRKTEVWKRETFKEGQHEAQLWKANEEFARASARPTADMS